MSERKVLTKWYPPDFDPSKIKRTKAPKNAGPKSQTVRLMAPFSMRCLSCGEYIYKGRKFNARKEHTEERYYSIPIYRFYIRCTRCSSEIVFKTDPKNMDYECEKNAVRNFEPWRDEKAADETEDQRLDRLEREEEEARLLAENGGIMPSNMPTEADGEGSAMQRLESKTVDSKREMAIADALDEIRMRNARNERAGAGEAVLEAMLNIEELKDEEMKRIEEEDEELARKAFMTDDGEKVRRLVTDGDEASADATANGNNGAATKEEQGNGGSSSTGAFEIPSFKRTVKKKKDLAGALGIKKKLKVPLV